MINVMNKRSYRGNGVYVGRPNVLGNPFYLKSESERNKVIAEYDIWLTEKMKSDTPQKREIRRLRKLYKTAGELTLICWCAPKACHADVIKRFIEGGAA